MKSRAERRADNAVKRQLKEQVTAETKEIAAARHRNMKPLPLLIGAVVVFGILWVLPRLLSTEAGSDIPATPETTAQSVQPKAVPSTNPEVQTTDRAQERPNAPVVENVPAELPPYAPPTVENTPESVAQAWLYAVNTSPEFAGDSTQNAATLGGDVVNTYVASELSVGLLSDPKAKQVTTKVVLTPGTQGVVNTTTRQSFSAQVSVTSTIYRTAELSYQVTVMLGTDGWRVTSCMGW